MDFCSFIRNISVLVLPQLSARTGIVSPLGCLLSVVYVLTKADLNAYSSFSLSTLSCPDFYC